MEIKATVDEFGFVSTNAEQRKQGDAIFVCMDGLRRRVRLPKDVKTLYAVFTRRPTKESFKLREDGRVCSVRACITWRTRDTFAKVYAAGYRYVHVEYDA